jgi:hypothetical protein
VADSTAEVSVVGSVPPSSTSRGGSSARGEADPYLLQRSGEREISMVVAWWNQRRRRGGLDCEGSHRQLQS